MSRIGRATLVLVALGGAAAPLTGQQYLDRRGLWWAVGGSAAITDISCPGCEFAGTTTSPSTFVRAGGTLDDSWTAGVEFIGLVNSRNGFDTRTIIITVAGFFYPERASGFHLVSGIGGALFREETTGTETSANGFVFRVGAGYDVPVSRGFAITPTFTALFGPALDGKRNRQVFISQDVRLNLFQFGIALTRH